MTSFRAPRRNGFVGTVNGWDVHYYYSRYYYGESGYLARADIAVHYCGRCARTIVLDRMARWGETSEQFVEKLAAMSPHVHDAAD